MSKAQLTYTAQHCAFCIFGCKGSDLLANWNWNADSNNEKNTVNVWYPACGSGVGYTMIGVNMMVSTYYNVILALSILYLAASFTSHLPWSDCDNWWNHGCAPQMHSNLMASILLFKCIWFLIIYSNIGWTVRFTKYRRTKRFILVGVHRGWIRNFLKGARESRGRKFPSVV